MDLGHFICINSLSFNLYKNLFYNKIIYYNFYIIIESSLSLKTLSSNIINNFKEYVTIDILSNYIHIHNNEYSIKIMSNTYKYYSCINDISYNFSIIKLKEFAMNISKYNIDYSLHIFKKYNNNIIHIYAFPKNKLLMKKHIKINN